MRITLKIEPTRGEPHCGFQANEHKNKIFRIWQALEKFYEIYVDLYSLLLDF